MCTLKKVFPHRESNPGRLGENQESLRLDHMGFHKEENKKKSVNRDKKGKVNEVSGYMYKENNSFKKIENISNYHKVLTLKN